MKREVIHGSKQTTVIGNRTYLNLTWCGRRLAKKWSKSELTTTCRECLKESYKFAKYWKLEKEFIAALRQRIKKLAPKKKVNLIKKRKQ